MRFSFLIICFAVNSCFGQKGIYAEVMAGASGYSGDLTQSSFSFHTAGPAGGIGLKYVSGDFFEFRVELFAGKVSGDDKFNSHADLKNRNLNFKTNILEGSACVEFNLADPDIYFSYPYLFGGIGVFHFNPYTSTSTNKKVYLQPLSTEGEGLPEYPGRNKYSLTQVCLPFGGGWKVKIHDGFMLSFEFGIRYLFTDYLDDVSTTYVDPEILRAEKGALAVEVASRQAHPAIPGDIRGNPKVKDMYGFGGVKAAFYLGRKKK
ncbi:MAG TPA: DUF6089 family protein [Chitinophagaceae bacterium]|nr:DUF6089 family protein [Chitinophagaceae bacterium]